MQAPRTGVQGPDTSQPVSILPHLDNPPPEGVRAGLRGRGVPPQAGPGFPSSPDAQVQPLRMPEPDESIFLDAKLGLSPGLRAGRTGRGLAPSLGTGTNSR